MEALLKHIWFESNTSRPRESLDGVKSPRVLNSREAEDAAGDPERHRKSGRENASPSTTTKVPLSNTFHLFLTRCNMEK